MKREENNKNKTGKKAQFYLIAAILIVISISGIIGIKNYAVTKEEPTRIRDLSSELKEETARVVDYGIYNADGVCEGVITGSKCIEDFIEAKLPNYFLQSTYNASVIFVYGNKENLNFATYEEEGLGDVSASFGSSSINWGSTLVGVVNKTTKINVLSDDVTVNVLGNSYKFNLPKESEGDKKVFYFVIAQEKDGERYIEKND